MGAWRRHARDARRRVALGVDARRSDCSTRVPRCATASPRARTTRTRTRNRRSRSSRSTTTRRFSRTASGPRTRRASVLRVSSSTPSTTCRRAPTGKSQVMVEGQRVFTPIRLDQGTNVGVYAKKDRLVAAGLVWDDARMQLAEKAYLVEEPIGQGPRDRVCRGPELSARSRKRPSCCSSTPSCSDRRTDRRLQVAALAALDIDVRSSIGLQRCNLQSSILSRPRSRRTGLVLHAGGDGFGLLAALAARSVPGTSSRPRRTSRARAVPPVSAGYFETSSRPSGVMSMPSKSLPMPT